MLRSNLLPTLVLAGSISGCGSDPKPPPTAPSEPMTSPALEPEAQPPRAAERASQISQIDVDDDIRRACGLTRAEAYFAYDSANLRAKDRRVFKKLADCFTDGALAGREMLLVGRADPRGGEEYNFVLGDHRAQSVARALRQLEVESSQIHTSSRGEMDAQGNDEASWAEDRRVNIKLYN